MVEQMASSHEFVPTLIAHMPVNGEEIVGNALFELMCKALATGQALMAVGRYIVRGIVLQCGRRARAIRHSNGAFEVA